jgi:hypothetical protein
MTATRCLLLSLIVAALTPPAADAQRVWLQQGPGPNTLGQVEGITNGEVVGAIKSVAVHPTNADIMFVGAVNGGIWRTGNATAASPNWVPQLALDQSLNIGAIAYDPTDATNQTLMAGAGRFSSFGGRGHNLVGVWRTTDDGATWTLLNGGGTLTGINVSGVAPRGATLVLSANTATPFANRGVWRSINTGANWTQISGGAGTGLPLGASHDLAADPTNNARLYTNSGTTGIYRSDDTGATWTKVSDAAVDAALVGSTNVKISVGDANNVYVAIVAGGAIQLSGLFRSGDGGGTWTALDLPFTTENGFVLGTHPGGQGTTHLSIQADLTDDDVVYVAGDRQPFQDEGTTNTCVPCFPNSISANDFSGRLFRVDASLAAGTQATHITHTNTTNASSPHADSRDMAIDASGNLIETDDGGVYRRTTPLLNTGDWFSLNGDIKVTEFHDIAWDAVSKVAVGGAQDTGTPEQLNAGNVRWRSVSTADGGDVAIDDFGTPGSSIRYTSNQRLSRFRRRTVDAANTVTATVFPALTVVGGGAALVRTFKMPVAVNAVDPTRLIIVGGNSVYESSDQGNTISEIGVGIAQNTSNRDAIAYGAAGNADMLYVGSGDQVFIRNAAPPAVLTASATYPGAGTGRGVVDVVMDPAAPLVAYVADTTTVYRTPDGGATWVDITGDLMTLTPGSIRSITYSTSNADGAVIVGTQNGVYMAVGPAFNAWAEVAVGLPRAPVSDVHYNPADEILVAGLLGRGAWSVSLEERDPVDVALVLDFSGSMLSPACGGCDPKHEVLKDAVELFVQLWNVLTIPADRFGLNYFRTNINEFLVGGSALFPAAPNAAAIIGDVRGQTPSNATAMGGGIQQAVNRLTDATRPRNIILFTDGMQNVNPMVDATTFVIDNVPGRTNSNVNPTMPATDLNAALGIKVNTIGVGATPAFVDLLDDIASQTNGLFKLTTAPDDDLRRFYVEDLVDVLRTFSPQLIAYRYATLPADSAIQVFTTNVTARQVVFKLSWKRAAGGGAQMGIRVVKNGVDLTRYGRIISGPFYRIFTINVPTTVSGQPVTPGGDWQVFVSGVKGTRYEIAGLVEEETLEYEFSLGTSPRAAGAPIPLSVRLSFAGQPVTNAQVTARVLAPRQSLATLLATNATPAAPPGFQYETGATVAQRKLQLLLGQPAFRTAMLPDTSAITFTNNGNGTYSASFAATAQTGAYTVIFSVNGQRADIGTYERTEIRSISVRFGTPLLATSSVSAVPAGRAPAGQRWELTLRPRDSNGNYLGPDYGHAIVVTVNGARLTTPPVDRLDGSYLFQFTSNRPPAATDISITVLGQPLYTGPLPGIQGRGAAAVFALSAHVGLAFPSSGFPAAAKTGLLLEGDLEWRITQRFALEGVFGRYDFGSPGDITGGALFAKAYVPGAAWRPYAAIGAGAYSATGGGTAFGVGVTGGLNRPLAGRLEFDAAAGYLTLFNAATGTSSSTQTVLMLKAGLKLAL